jgi:threonine aldolase
VLKISNFVVWQPMTTFLHNEQQVTRPSVEMMQAMMAAPVGDDVWGDDPTINQLQQEAAALFGKEAALFCPSGTMTNQSR